MSFFSRFRKPTPKKEDLARVSVNLFDDQFLRRLETLSLTSRRANAGVRRGERRSRKKGSGVEFADHRPYAPGDDIRFLDIGVYQRFGKLLLRLFEEEEDLSLYFLVDTSASMAAHNSSKLNQAAKITAALAYVALASLDRVSVLTLNSQIATRLPPTRGKARAFRVLRFLSEMSASGQTDLSQALKAFVAQNRRRGLAILLTDLYDPQGFEAGLNVLRFNKFDVVVLHLVDRLDAEPNLRGDLRLVDSETQEEREVSVTPQLMYKLQEEVERRQEEIERFCASRGVLHIRVDAQAPFDEVVLKVLRAGGLLR